MLVLDSPKHVCSVAAWQKQLQPSCLLLVLLCFAVQTVRGVADWHSVKKARAAGARPYVWGHTGSVSYTVYYNAVKGGARGMPFMKDLIRMQ